MFRTSRPRGFTLIELLVVVGIIAVLMSMSLYVISYVQKKKKIVATTAMIYALRTALENYRATWATYPIRPGGSGAMFDNGSGTFDPGYYNTVCAPLGSKSTGTEDNSALIKALLSTGDLEGLKQSELKNGKLYDAFGSPVIIRFMQSSVIAPGGAKPLEKVMIWSYGPDGVNDTPGPTNFINKGLPVYDSLEIDAMLNGATQRDDIGNW